MDEGGKSLRGGDEGLAIWICFPQSTRGDEESRGGERRRFPLLVLLPLPPTSTPTMFKRPYSSKTVTPIRSSDLRKLRDELCDAFPSTLDKETAKQLLDGALTAKATSHLDEPLSLVLVPSKAGGEPDPRLFRVGKGNDGYLVPTIYTLDLVPYLLPKLETAPAVVENLISGSGAFSPFLFSFSALNRNHASPSTALFLSGISTASLRALPAGAKEGDLVSVFIREDDETGDEKEDVIVAVGWLAADKETLLRQQKEGGQTKGKGVTTVRFLPISLRRLVETELLKLCSYMLEATTSGKPALSRSSLLSHLPRPPKRHRRPTNLLSNLNPKLPPPNSPLSKSPLLPIRHLQHHQQSSQQPTMTPPSPPPSFSPSEPFPPLPLPPSSPSPLPRYIAPTSSPLALPSSRMAQREAKSRSRRRGGRVWGSS